MGKRDRAPIALGGPRAVVTPEQLSPFVSGVNWGWPESVKVHSLANIVGDDITVGENCRIDAFVTITGKVRLGKNVHIGTGVCIFGAAGVEIGDYSTLSPGVKVFTATDDVRSSKLASPTIPAKQRGMIEGSVKIGAYTVVGANSVVGPKVTIGDQVQIGALSYVPALLNHGESQPYESGRVFAGIPARFIRSRCPVEPIE